MKKNTISLLLAALLCTSVFTGCLPKDTPPAPEKNEQKVSENTEKGTVTRTPATEAVDDTEVYGLNDYTWKYADDEVMYTINDIPVTFDMFRHFVMYNKSAFEAGDPSHWNETTTKEYFDIIKEEFKYYYANMLLAKEKGLDLTEEDHAYIDGQMQNLITNIEASSGMSFEENLSEMFLTEKVYRDLVEYDYYAQNIMESKVDENQLNEHFRTNYVTVQHVLISTVDDARQPLPEDQIAEKEKLANDIYARAMAGEDFRSLIDEYGEDPGMTVQDSYTFTKGEMVAEFEAKSFEIAEGEISLPVKTDYGYHIIKKLPLQVPEKDSEVWLNAVYQLGYDEYVAELDAYIAGLVVVETDAYKSITMDNIGTLKVKPAKKTEAAVEDTSAPVAEAVAEDTSSTVEDASVPTATETQTATEPETAAVPAE